ncbi:MAG TPA: malonyl-CoA decarboxylase family protein [Candidatus Elarobacter sp.]|nr:malonyl-CoA decarboxylase family protein [Candidatus Elarobacter sp.]
MPARATPVERAVDALRRLPLGDLAARDHVRTVRSTVAVANEDELLRFLRLLDGLGVDAARVDRDLERARSADPSDRRAALARLRGDLEPARDAVLRHLAAPPGDLRFVVDLRAALMALIAKRADAADLKPLDDDLRTFLASRLDLGLLELRRLTWSDSAALLERLARSEAVHAVRGWFDLKDRLDEDRRVYAFFHPALPGTPLVFTEVALTDEIPSSIRAILNKDAPRVDAESARCATFYSISNCEPGLTGIPFGNALIKHAVELLRQELPKLRTFATLSPLPGFAAWVRSLGERVAAEVRAALATPGWHRDPVIAAAVREPVLRLAARYLLSAKRADGAPRDAVARFHLANGAQIERLDWLGDTTPRGLEQAYGVMVNYRYALDRYAANQLAYATDHAVEASAAVKALANADTTPLGDEPAAAVSGISRRGALLAAMRGVAQRAKRLVVRTPASA